MEILVTRSAFRTFPMAFAVPYHIWYTLRVEMEKKISVVFFRTQAGNEPVRDWLKGLPIGDKKNIGEDLKAVELSWPLGLPLVRKL
jgi:hypothetical protein